MYVCVSVLMFLYTFWGIIASCKKNIFDGQLDFQTQLQAVAESHIVITNHGAFEGMYVYMYVCMYVYMHFTVRIHVMRIKFFCIQVTWST